VGTAHDGIGRNGNGFVVPVPGSIDGHIEDFLADCGLRGMTPGTIEGYRSCLRIWSGYLAERGITPDSGREHLESFLRHLRGNRGLTHTTLKGYFAVLSSFYKYLVYKDVVPINPVLPVRDRYLRTYKKNGNGKGGVARRVPTTDELALMIRCILDPRDRALVMVLAKTGVRRSELIAMDVDDIDWEEGSITLKNQFAKRSNRVVFFDAECERSLRHWLKMREKLATGSPALFVGVGGGRLKRRGVYDAILKHAERTGLHDAGSKRREDHFGPHSLRYWFTHSLLQAGMRREMVQELRGDSRRDAVDIYDRIPREELRYAYLTFMPELRV